MRITSGQAQLGLLTAAAVLWAIYLYTIRPDAGNGRIRAPQHAGTIAGASTRVPYAETGSEHRQDSPQQREEERTAVGKALPTEKGADTGPAGDAPRGPGIVQLNFMGRLGNNLFEYAAARALADRLGWALSIQPARYNKKKYGLLTRPEGMACFPGVRPVGPALSSPEMAALQTVKFRGVHRELEDPAPRSIEMEGWFQDYGMFSSEKDRLRKIMALSPSCCGPTAPGPDDLVIHHRNYRAELTAEQYEHLIFKDLEYEFYEAVLRDAAVSAAGRPETVWVVGEFGDEEPLFKRLQQDQDNVKRAEMVEDQFHAFCFLTRASRLVMAHSTFSWWVAFLGNATEVHFPLTKQNKGVTGPSISVDESRYVYRDDDGRVVPAP